METIELHIREEADLYNKFDPSLISEDVISFLEKRIRKVTDDLSISIISELPIDESKVKAAFRFYTEEQYTIPMKKVRFPSKECTDHTGVTYPSIKEMCAHWGDSTRNLYPQDQGLSRMQTDSVHENEPEQDQMPTTVTDVQAEDKPEE